MSNEAYFAKVIERLTNASRLDDAEFFRAWGCCVNRDVAMRVSESSLILIADSMERMAAMDVDGRSNRAIISASGILHVFLILVEGEVLHLEDIVRVINCCAGNNIVLTAELVRCMLDNMATLIPLASEQLIQLSHQSVELPADRRPNEFSTRGLAFLTLAEDGIQHAPALINADNAKRECVETLWNWRLESSDRYLYRYEDAVNAMTAAIRQCKAATSG